MARPKTKPETPAAPPADPHQTFDALMATAGVDSTVAALAGSGASRDELTAELTANLRAALARWGLGLHHLTHEAQLSGEGENADIVFLTDGRPVANLSGGVAALARAYGDMTAPDERGLSLWAVLPEGHRLSADAPAATLKILIEEARDFETHWMAGRGGTFHRVWRQSTPERGEVLSVEVMRPADAEAALSDAAWDVITSIKDRTFQRELMRRSEEVGMLGALLAARHAGASDSLSRLPEAHFAVQAMLGTLTGEEARNAESYRTLLRQLTGELEQAQQGATRTLSDVLRHGLRG